MSNGGLYLFDMIMSKSTSYSHNLIKMLSFCVICMPPLHRRPSASKTMELYSSYNETSRAFENTNCQSMGEHSKLTPSKCSLNQLIYYVNFNYITTHKSTSLQILDDSISTCINIFIHKHKNKTHTPNKTQNTIDLSQTINAQISHSSSQLVYWDNKYIQSFDDITNRFIDYIAIINDENNTSKTCSLDNKKQNPTMAVVTVKDANNNKRFGRQVTTKRCSHDFQSLPTCENETQIINKRIEETNNIITSNEYIKYEFDGNDMYNQVNNTHVAMVNECIDSFTCSITTTASAPIGNVIYDENVSDLIVFLLWFIAYKHIDIRYYNYVNMEGIGYPTNVVAISHEYKCNEYNIDSTLVHMVCLDDNCEYTSGSPNISEVTNMTDCLCVYNNHEQDNDKRIDNQFHMKVFINDFII